MIDLTGELKALITILEEQNIDYALCGGLAMAVHGYYRTTDDIDVLIRSESLEKTKTIARNLGYTIEAQPMIFAKGAVEMRRLSKIDRESGFVLSLDMLLVTPQTEEAWASRTEFEWANQRLKVVSREGLVALKLLRNNGIDQEDIKYLQEVEDEG
jgi:hypothetical protein